MKAIRISYLFILSLLILASCLESPDMTEGIVNGKKPPTVETKMVGVVPEDGVLHLEGEIIATGKSDKILSKGFYWSEINPNPTKNDNVINLNSESFSAEIKNVSGEKTIYWKAFAENEFGFDYGEVSSFATPLIWEERANFVAPIRGFFSSCVLNDELLLFGGQKNSGQTVLNETWIYNTKNDSWQSTRADFDGIRRYPSSFTIDNNVYVGAGQRTGTSLYNDFYRMDGDSYFWYQIETEEDMTPRYDAGSFSLNGKGYIVGGSGVNYPYALHDVWQFDPVSEKWKRINDFPTIFSGGVSIYGENRAFVGFGKKESEIATDRILWEYDDKNDTWIIISELPESFQFKVTGATILKNTIYVINSNLEIWTLNLTTLEWELKTTAPNKLKIGIDDAKNLMLTHNNSIYIGLNFSEYLFEYRPFWDN